MNTINMTKKMVLVMVFLAVCVAGMLPVAAVGDTALPAATFGVVDMNRVMRTTEVAKDIFSQMESKRKEYQVSIAKEEDALRSSEQAIMKQKDSLSKDEFDKKRKEFEEKVIRGQKLVQDRKRILDQAFNSSMGSLRNEAAKIVADIAKEKNYMAVLTQDAVMISAPSLDMTDMVIERMNKGVKKIPIDWAATAATVENAANGDRKK
ncbi:MAG: OmpH family outer membrane protein [Proteobacteria bacterium]|nr:OmpH family outer membrane protein [Pseudomonadota bacterium]